MNVSIFSKMTVRVAVAAVAVLLMTGWSNAASITWTGTDGTNPTFWDINTTTNWDNGGATVYQNGDAVTFNNTASGTVVDLQSSVSPLSTTINSSTNAFTFNGGDIASGTVSVFGTQIQTFTQDVLTFPGGTDVNNARIDFLPTSTGPHSFGTDAITLNTGTSTWFNYDPVIPGEELTNDFIVNGSIVWRNAGAINDGGTWRPKNPGTSGVRTGDIYLNGTMILQIGTAGCVGCDQGTNLDQHVILTGNRTISGGERFYGAATTISGDISSQGGPHDLTLRHRGDNSDWEFFISGANVTDPNGWDVQNIRRETFSTGNGTVVFQVDETQFFNNMTANGGSLFHTGGGMRFHDQFTPVIGANPTANINFSLIVEPSANGQGTGFRVNNQFNVIDGGLLGGNGIYRSGPEGGSVTPFNNALNVSVFDGGTISPGNHELNGGIGQMTIQGDLTFVDGGQLTIQVDGSSIAGTDYDQLLVTAASGSGGGGDVSGTENAMLFLDFDPLLNFSELDGVTLTILDSENLISSSFGSVMDNFNNPEGTTFTYDVLFQGNQILVTNFQLEIPEPSAGILVLGMLGICLRKRRHARRA